MKAVSIHSWLGDNPTNSETTLLKRRKTMSKTSRREMLKKVGAAGTVAAGLGLAPVNSRSASLVDDDNGPLANATVSFGEWMTTPPLDRYPNQSPMTANHHELIPKTVKIKAGGTVNFII